MPSPIGGYSGTITSLRADAAFIESAGHTAALYQDELYELRSGRNGYARLQQFGVIFGFRRVVIYLEPRKHSRRHITSNTARNQLLVNSKPLPWNAWAAEFAEENACRTATAGCR